MAPTVGVVSAGDMGAAIGAALAANGLDAATSLEGRSALTRTRAAEAGMRDAGSLTALVERSDLLLSVLPPADALSVAEEIADAMARTGARPVFAECNAVAPRTAQRIATLIGDAGASVIDAGIIGPPPAPGSRTRIYCSGPDTAPLEALREHGLDVRRVGPRIGQASGLKMVYAASTKGTTALWTELLTAAEAMGLTDALPPEPPTSSTSPAPTSTAGKPASTSADCAASNPTPDARATAASPSATPPSSRPSSHSERSRPATGKDKIAVELRKDGWAVSASMAGRILSDAIRREEARNPPRAPPDPASAAATPAPSVPTPSESPKTTGRPAQATSSKSTPSTSARSPA